MVEQSHGAGWWPSVYGPVKAAGETVDALRDGAQAGGTVVHRVKTRHIGQQRLRRADV